MTGKMCSKCDVNEAGPGGILCPSCVTAISSQATDDLYAPEVMERARQAAGLPPQEP